MEFSVMFFGAGGSHDAAVAYEQVLGVAREVDGTSIRAVWTPERHYHPFGGLFPQPAVLSAAIAAQTQNLRIRAGSIVAPLHRSAEIVEQWAIVDALSHGRAELALASGWNSVDFWSDPSAYPIRHALVEQRVHEVREIWFGGEFDVTAPDGVARRIRTYPTPVQKALPLWLAAAGSPETFSNAGRLGTSVLTHQLGQSTEVLAENIRAYRTAFYGAGHDPAGARVAVMLHTHVGVDDLTARAAGQEALTEYLLISLDLDLTQRPGAEIERQRQQEVARLRAETHVRDTALIGGYENASARLATLREAGVDEVAFLIDFGIAGDLLVPQARLLAQWAPLLQRDLAGSSVEVKALEADL